MFADWSDEDRVQADSVCPSIGTGRQSLLRYSVGIVN
jgi:hypothetical protein